MYSCDIFHRASPTRVLSTFTASSSTGGNGVATSTHLFVTWSHAPEEPTSRHLAKRNWRTCDSRSSFSFPLTCVCVCLVLVCRSVPQEQDYMWFTLQAVVCTTLCLNGCVVVFICKECASNLSGSSIPVRKMKSSLDFMHPGFKFNETVSHTREILHSMINGSQSCYSRHHPGIIPWCYTHTPVLNVELYFVRKLRTSLFVCIHLCVFDIAYRWHMN